MAYALTPVRVVGDGRAEGVEFVHTGSDQECRIDAGLVLTSIGYRGTPVADLPFDETAAVVPNERGRVLGSPGAYVAGWIKRGPTGFIGTNKSCAAQTVQELVADFNAGRLADPTRSPAALDGLVRSRQPRVVGAAGWRAIDAAEIARGAAGGRPRNKFTAIADMLAAASMAPKPTVRERIRTRLRG